ncbi:uncharacterized protein E0L32_007262 [Thyridium curvatum]|uniref:Mitochondrial import inner membrane translocase subunit Tim21 n=1 Tax=Thyridium curvatum TaxID=1093900 RepID=A0A507B3Q8_9PEZI|nr:uncharacterized protein E0L32_007262 [Thyridium curvatum]TPX11959.1 hypothetical protein E0L32_007262 [Thyridium curvatum]
MKPATLSVARYANALSSRTGSPALPLLLQRSYATQQGVGGSSSSSPSAKRRAVTPFNDDGHVPWTDLSAGEKTGRAVQQTFNLGMVVVGLVLTVLLPTRPVTGVGYLLYTEVFSPDSKVSHFNRAVDRIKKDHRCLELLGDSKTISAFGEETYNKWRRARPIASSVQKDPQGNEHLLIHFNVEGSRGRGVANIHMIKRANGSDYEYKYFYVDVKGHQRIYLENAETSSKSVDGKTRLFGIRWN